MKKLIFTFILVFGMILFSQAQEYKITRFIMGDLNIPFKGKVILKDSLFILSLDENPIEFKLSKSFKGEYPFKVLLPDEEEFIKIRISLVKGEDGIQLKWDSVDQFTHEWTKMTYVLEEIKK